MKEIASRALNLAQVEGARYADIRIINSRQQMASVKDGHVDGIGDQDSQGFGVRVLVGNSWGFASSAYLSGVEIDRVTSAVRYEIDFTAGYGSSGVDVPQPLRQAIRLLVTHWYENRSAVVLGDDASATPLGYRELVAPYRRMALC